MTFSKHLSRFFLLFHPIHFISQCSWTCTWNSCETTVTPHSLLPSPHPRSCQRCIVLYVHSILSFIIFVPLLPPVHYKCPPPPPPLHSCLLPQSPFSTPDFLALTCSAVWHIHDVLTDGCPGLCNNNGRCVLDQNVWHCICQSGWRGLGCDVATETLCSDGKDNEGGRKK